MFKIFLISSVLCLVLMAGCKQRSQKLSKTQAFFNKQAGQDKFNTFQWKNYWRSKGTAIDNMQIWQEWWYLKVVLPEKPEGFYFVYGVNNPGDLQKTKPGTLALVAAAQMDLTKKPKHLHQLKPMKSFVASGENYLVELEGAKIDNNQYTGELQDPAGDSLQWSIKLKPDWKLTFTDLYYDLAEKFGMSWYPANPSAKCSGTVIHNGREINFTDAPCYQDHNWGTQYPHSWYWMASNTFDNNPDSALLVGGTVYEKLVKFETGIVALRHKNKEYLFTPETFGIADINIKPGEWLIEARQVSLGTDYRIEVRGKAPKKNFSYIQAITPPNDLYHIYETLLGDIEVKLYQSPVDKTDDWLLIAEIKSTKTAAIEFGMQDKKWLDQLFDNPKDPHYGDENDLEELEMLKIAQQRANVFFDSCYLSGQLAYNSEKNQYLVMGEKKAYRLVNTDKLLWSEPTNWQEIKGQMVHVAGNCQPTADGIIDLTPEYLIALKDKVVPEFPTYNPKILSIEPYSIRDIAFSKQYYQISKASHQYLGDPFVATTLTIEPHAIADIAENKKMLEDSLNLHNRFAGSLNSKWESFISLASQGLAYKGAFAMIKKNGLDQEQTLSDMEAVYKNFTSISMVIFRHLASPELSGLAAFFRTAEKQGKYFNGLVECPDDVNNLLKMSYYYFFLAAHSDRVEIKKQFSYIFSILFIAHEQAFGQPYFERIRAQYVAYSGILSAFDPLGEYKLATAPWADIRVRMSLDRQKPFKIAEYTPSLILHNDFSAGTIPHYYFTRIFNNHSFLLMEPPTEKWNKWPDPMEYVPTANSDVSPTQNGITLLKTHGCMGCHLYQNQGGLAGPDLSKIGQKLNVTAIRQSIIDPNAVISKNCTGGNKCLANLMPGNYGESITREVLEAIVTFLSNSK